MVYAGWDDAKAVLPGEVLELRWGKQGVEARIPLSMVQSLHQKFAR